MEKQTVRHKRNPQYGRWPAAHGHLLPVLSLPAILSYLDYLPFYRRGNGTTPRKLRKIRLPGWGLLSSIAPFSVTRQHDWLATNPTSREYVCGHFSPFFPGGIRLKKWTGTQRFIAISTAVIFLFPWAMQRPYVNGSSNSLPGMNLFRHPGTMRIFCIMGLLPFRHLNRQLPAIGRRKRTKSQNKGLGFAGIFNCVHGHSHSGK